MGQNAQELSEDDFVRMTSLYLPVAEWYSSMSQTIHLTIHRSLRGELQGAAFGMPGAGFFFFLSDIFYLIFFSPCGSVMWITMFAVENSN